jgi:hypothetical protein
VGCRLNAQEISGAESLKGLLLRALAGFSPGMDKRTRKLIDTLGRRGGIARCGQKRVSGDQAKS